ncbi:MAG: hypothetical protein LQ345_002600 [Seirophora villosa]|nr:MAG: hypothetical protein LQ345_002600 [Seirophora villosa]
MALLSLPPEVISLVTGDIPYRHDLSNLSMTCKSLKAQVFPRLYERLVLKVPQTWDELSHIESLVLSAGEGLQYTTSIRIVPQTKRFDYGRATALPASTEAKTLCGDISIPHALVSKHLNTIVRMLLKRLPKQRLIEFSWEHSCFMTPSTLRCLAKTQVPGLKRLRIDGYEDDDIELYPGILGIESLALNVTSDNLYGLYLGCLLKDNSDSLQHLSLGAEIQALRRYHKTDHDHSDSTTDWLGNLMKEFILGDVDVYGAKHGQYCLAVNAFELKGLDFSEIINPHSVFLDLPSLTSLKLESCVGLDRAFEVLAAGKNSKGCLSRSELRLRSFHIRQESSSPRLVAHLLIFLGAITGLTHLSVLLEGTALSPAHEVTWVLIAHGKSLRSLVWDERLVRRTWYIPPREDIPTPHIQLETIAEYCPYLVELGILMDWRAFTTVSKGGGGSHDRQSTRFAFRKMKHLRTLNIRNMPYINPKATMLNYEELHASYATSVLKTLQHYPHEDTINLRAHSTLQTLALGALTYRDVYNGLGCYPGKEKDLYKFLRLQVFKVGRYRLDGQERTLAMHIESGTYEKTQAAGGDVNIFKPYWLG